MRRTTLLIYVFASVIIGGAWWTQARASFSSSARTNAAAPAPPVPQPTRKLDEYGNISWSDEKPRLDNFAIELQVQSAATGYIICYGGRRGWSGEARRRCQRAAGYVIGHRRIEDPRAS